MICNRTMRRLSQIIALILAILVIAPAAETFAADDFTAVSPTKNITVKNDDGNGTVFKELPANYVQLKDLYLGTAKIVSGSGYSIVNGVSTNNSDETVQPHLVWTGKVTFGGARRTATKNAVTKANTLPAVTIRFPDGAELSDGRKADVEMKIDNISVNLTKSMSSSITSSSTVKVALLRNGGSSGRPLWMVTTSPKTSYSDHKHNAMAGVGQRYRVTMRILESGKDTAISASDYPSMLILFKDLDVPDETLARHDNDSKYWPQRYKGKFAEGVEMVSGWGNPAVLAHEGSKAYERPLVTKNITGNNLQIKGDGSRYAAFGSKDDSSSYYSGFAAPVSPQGFTFFWTGSVPGNKAEAMGTQIGSQPTVAVWAKRTEGGSLTNSSVDDWKKNTHLMNSSGIYSYKPDAGYAVKSLKVDGEEIKLTEEQKASGGEYIFERLNKNPIAKRVERNGNILDASDSSHYEIEVVFEKVEVSVLRLSKNVTGSLGDKTKEFRFSIELSGMPAGYKGNIKTDGAILGEGAQNETYTAGTGGSVKISATLHDDTSLEIGNLPAGAVFSITEEKSDHFPSYTVNDGSTEIKAASEKANKAISTGSINVNGGLTYTAAFTNERSIAVNTGVADGSDLPLGAAGCACAAGIAAAGTFVIRRRSNYR